MKIRSAIIIVFLLGLFLNILPVSGEGKPARKRPRVGVVLSGGGAKGFAHVAVLRRLEELGIPVDYIGGTSMGGTVAALYSMGYTVDELERIAYDTDWFTYFSNDVSRSNKYGSQKIFSDRYPFRLNVDSRGIDIPSGLVNGHRISIFLSRLTWGARNVRDYSRLPIPFLCIATDMETGKQEVMRKGLLSESLRATMAIPTIFSPVEIKGRIYSDGGVVNNFPVKELRDMGADIIIGVDVGAPLYQKKDLKSLAAIIEQTTSFVGIRKTEEQRELCDILITPAIEKFSATSFDRTAEIIAAGEKATDREMNKLTALAGRFRKFEIPERGRIVPDRKNPSVRVKDIVYHGLSSKTEKIMADNLPIKNKSDVTVDDIESAVTYTYGTGFFDRVSYSLEKGEQGDRLHLYFTERPESNINFGLSYDLEMKSAILLGAWFRDLGIDNTRMEMHARVGEYSRFDASYFLYTPIDPGIGIGTRMKSYNMDVYLYQDGRKISSYDFLYYSGSIYLASFFSNWFVLDLAVNKESFQYQAEISGRPEDDDFDFDILSGSAKLKIDSLDEYNYPSKGIFFEGGVSYVRTDLAWKKENYYDRKFWHESLNGLLAIPLSEKFSFIAGGGTAFSDSENVPPVYQFAMGGYQRSEDWVFPLNGYSFMERTARHGWVYFFHLQYEVINNLFLTAKWNEGKATDSLDDLFVYRDTDAGFGFTAGYRTILGPVEVSFFRKRDDEDYLFHVNLGFRY